MATPASLERALAEGAESLELELERVVLFVRVGEALEQTLPAHKQLRVKKARFFEELPVGGKRREQAHNRIPGHGHLS